MKEQLKALFYKYEIEYNNEQLDILDKFYHIVIEENEKFNLTAITEENDFAIKHLLDSVLPYKFLPQNSTVIDVGAGAGFPSIPLKIIRPDLKVTMLDSLNKRVNFLNETVGKLGLKNITALHDRAEDFAQKNREKFDVCVARAVASLPTLAEYCIPFVKVGGLFIAMKGSAYQEEVDSADFAICELGGRVKDIQKVFITEIDSERGNVLISKVKQTSSKYPRGKNLPRLKPLNKV